MFFSISDRNIEACLTYFRKVGGILGKAIGRSVKGCN